MKPKPFATETALCAAFTAAIGKDWIAYNETAGWDILLVRKADGFQIGVQAKLKLNPLVLAQCLDDSMYRVDHAAPDCRAILVPWNEVNAGLSFLSAYIGITIIRMSTPELKRYHRDQFDPQLPDFGGREWTAEHWYEQAPSKRCKLPEYVPDVPAGTAAPIQLTQWKIGALKIAVLLEERGHLTRADFRHLRVDHRRWVAKENRWLKVVSGRFERGDYFPDFKKQHPKVYAEIKKDAAKWMPGIASEQPALL